MLNLFSESVLWKVLTFFLSHPKTPIYIKELSRRLKLSPSGTNDALKLLREAGILSRKDLGKAHYYSLNKNLPLVKSLKISYFLALLENWKMENKFRDKEEDLISLIVYGNYATGEFNEMSTVDLLLISSQPKLHFLLLIQQLENYLSKKVNFKVINVTQWRNIKNEDLTLYQYVMRNHILLAGNKPL